MNPRTLTHPFAILGYRKDGRPIFPIMGGSEPPNQPPANPPADPPANPPANTAPVEATDEHGVGLGFPKDTATDKMTDAQRANYWRNQSKVQQAKVPSNLAELQAAKAELDQIKLSQQTPADQQIAQIKSETEARVREETNKEAVVALLRTSLHTAGKNQDEIDDLIGYVDPSKFLDTEKKLDAAKVSSYLAKIVPTGSAGGTGGIPGQGRYEQQAADKAAAGKTEAERRGFKPADRSQSSLIPR